MAHAMFRISYTTFILDKQYFAFVAKNPGGPTAASFCHVFQTEKKDDVIIIVTTNLCHMF